MEGFAILQVVGNNSWPDISISDIVKLRSSPFSSRLSVEKGKGEKRRGRKRKGETNLKRSRALQRVFRHRLDFPSGKKKRCGQAGKREAKQARALYIPWISAIVFFVKDRKCLVYPHRRALTFNRTLIDCGIYFFSYLQSRPPSSILLPPLSLLFLLLSASVSLRIPSAFPMPPSLSRIIRPSGTGLSFPFCFRSPTAVQIGEIKLRDGATAVIRRLHFSIMVTRGHIVALFQGRAVMSLRCDGCQNIYHEPGIFASSLSSFSSSTLTHFDLYAHEIRINFRRDIVYI